MTTIKDFWRRALDWLESAKREEPFHPDLTASCGYYAVFYALSALFAMEKKLFNSHDGIEIALHRDFIKVEILPTSVGVAFRKLRQFRRVGNYGCEQHVSKEEAKEALEAAQIIIESIFLLHPEIFSKPNWLNERKKSNSKRDHDNTQ